MPAFFANLLPLLVAADPTLPAYPLIERAVEVSGIKAADPPRGIYCRYRSEPEGYLGGTEVRFWADCGSGGWILHWQADFDGRVFLACFKEGRLYKSKDGAPPLECGPEDDWIRQWGQEEMACWLLPLLQAKDIRLRRLATKDGNDHVQATGPDIGAMDFVFDGKGGFPLSAESNWLEPRRMTLRRFQDRHLFRPSRADLDKAGWSGPSDLVGGFRKHTVASVDEKSLHAWITDLGSETYRVRALATQRLQQAGRPALPALRTAEKEAASLEQGRRLERLIAAIDDRAETRLLHEAARQLAWASEPDAAAAQALLAYLAATGEDAEVLAALTALASRQGEAHAALVAALDQDGPAAAVAAKALGRDGGAYLRRPGRELFLKVEIAHLVDVTAHSSSRVRQRQFLEDLRLYNEHPAALFADPVKSAEAWR